MRVCKHGSWQQDVLLFACKHEFEKGFELKNSSSLLYLPISSSAETWKIFRNMQRQCFFARADILSEKNFFSAKQGLSTRTSFVYKTLRLVRISLLISTLNKRVLLFPLESYFIKAIENFFPVFVYPDRNTRGVGKILDSYANPRLRLGFSWLSWILPIPLVFISGYANTENVFYWLTITIFVPSKTYA